MKTNCLTSLQRVGSVCLLVASLLFLATARPLAAGESSATPNIVYILCDDLGYGDVNCLNPAGKIATPNMDRLAAAGMVFTDAHSSSAVCTPTRYSVLTGRYNWRSRLQNGVLNGYSLHLIDPNRLTVPALLKRHGYQTACIGKWHLGLDWPVKASGLLRREVDSHDVDYTKPIQNGPLSVGFDYFFGISASLDMPPFVYLENDRVTELPTVEKKWVRNGPAAADFEAVDVLPSLTKRAVAYLEQRAAVARARKPFFLYLPLNSPHTPILPTREWQGKSGLNSYGDFVMETDWAVGEVLTALDRLQLANNTLVILTSDNGCSPSANFAELSAKGHQPSYHFRGAKADIYDGGHRIPFIANWPGKIKPGSRSTQLVCLSDLLATCAEILGTKLPDNAGEDSVSILPALLGRDQGRPLREAIVHHSINGSFSIRQGNWKLALCPGSGGWSAPKPGSPEEREFPPVQLFDLAKDPGEKTNLHSEHPDFVARLTRLLEKYIAEGRSTPGSKTTNDVSIKVLKSTRQAEKE